MAKNLSHSRQLLHPILLCYFFVIIVFQASNKVSEAQFVSGLRLSNLNFDLTDPPHFLPSHQLNETSSTSLTSQYLNEQQLNQYQNQLNNVKDQKIGYSSISNNKIPSQNSVSDSYLQAYQQASFPPQQTQTATSGLDFGLAYPNGQVTSKPNDDQYEHYFNNAADQRRKLSSVTSNPSIDKSFDFDQRLVRLALGTSEQPSASRIHLPTQIAPRPTHHRIDGSNIELANQLAVVDNQNLLSPSWARTTSLLSATRLSDHSSIPTTTTVTESSSTLVSNIDAASVDTTTQVSTNENTLLVTETSGVSSTPTIITTPALTSAQQTEIWPPIVDGIVYEGPATAPPPQDYYFSSSAEIASKPSNIWW